MSLQYTVVENHMPRSKSFFFIFFQKFLMNINQEGTKKESQSRCCAQEGRAELS